MPHPLPPLAVILPAAGASRRFGSRMGSSKLLAPLAGRAVLLHSLGAFLRRQEVTIVLIATAGGRSPWDEAPAELRDPRVRLCPGGENRAGSVLNALRLVPPSIDWVAIHDAARPLVSQELINRTCAAAIAHGAAVPALPMHVTVKQADGPLPARVQRTIARHTLWAMQTPQVMRRQALLDAFTQCPIPLAEVTDDAQLLELAHQDVWLVEGEEANLKITTPADLTLAEFWERRR